MGKLYTIDGKLLVEKPEIRIGDKVYVVDDREPTVSKAMKIEMSDNMDTTAMHEVIKLGLGEKQHKELCKQEYPFAAFIEIFKNIMMAMTGQDPEKVEARFQQHESK